MLESMTMLLTLTAMEIVLGIDNIIFIAIVVTKLPRHMQQRTRVIGLALALIFRVALLCSLSWMMGLTKPLVELGSLALSGRDLVLLGGGLFLVIKASMELHEKIALVEGGHADAKPKGPGRFVILQIIILDLVFSLDSIITAVGMANDIRIMVAAVIIAVIIMMVASPSISDFVDRHPTIKILALAFLVLIGAMLILESLGLHVPKGYIYFAMGFSLAVELLNMRYRKNHLSKTISDQVDEEQRT